MSIDERLQSVVVVGAGGKMGRGIAALLALDMARLRRERGGPASSHRLTLIDTRAEALADTRDYIAAQARRQTERAASPVAEGEEGFDAQVLRLVEAATDLDAARDARLVFEAIVEDETAKVSLLKELGGLCSSTTWFLSNTSSIPIRVLDEGAALDGRVLGFHFYNPPVVQRLVEIIRPPAAPPGLVALVHVLGRRLGKTLIEAGDTAGFIGNGHFVRDALYAMERVQDLAARLGEAGGVLALDRVSRDWLIRPMGILQLLDYVGLDVFAAIVGVMDRYLPREEFNAPLVSARLRRGLPGGQTPTGAQRDGFFRYNGREPVAVFSPSRDDYVPILEGRLGERVSGELGEPPAGGLSWKTLRSDSDREEKLAAYFRELARAPGAGARLALSYLQRTRDIAHGLVRDGVAASTGDVDRVLKEGFYHLYGPLETWLP